VDRRDIGADDDDGLGAGPQVNGCDVFGHPGGGDDLEVEVAADQDHGATPCGGVPSAGELPVVVRHKCPSAPEAMNVS